MLPFCNSYVLWLLSCVQLRLVTVTLSAVTLLYATFCGSTGVLFIFYHSLHSLSQNSDYKSSHFGSQDHVLPWSCNSGSGSGDAFVCSLTVLLPKYVFVNPTIFCGLFCLFIYWCNSALRVHYCTDDLSMYTVCKWTPDYIP